MRELKKQLRAARRLNMASAVLIVIMLIIMGLMLKDLSHWADTYKELAQRYKYLYDSLRESVEPEEIPEQKPGDPLLGDLCTKAEKNAAGQCMGYKMGGGVDDLRFECGICEKQAEYEPEEDERA